MDERLAADGRLAAVKVKAVMASLGFRAEILPVEWIHWLEAQAQNFVGERDVDWFSADTVMNYYNFDLPRDFEAKSIVLAAMPGRQVPVVFDVDGREAIVPLPPTYSDTLSGMAKGEALLNEVLKEEGFQAVLAPAIPAKPLVVASGMGGYGRNNIVYIDGLGSYFGLAAYYCDLSCPEERKDPAADRVVNWTAVDRMAASQTTAAGNPAAPLPRMDVCESCCLCAANCPTGAIGIHTEKTGAVIRASRCVTYYNEVTEEDFPQWIPTGAHQYLFGCMACQKNCPANEGMLQVEEQAVCFDRDETEAILNGISFDQLPQRTQEKLITISAQEPYYSKLARNIKAAIRC